MKDNKKIDWKKLMDMPRWQRETVMKMMAKKMKEKNG